ncbi:hypothetical protein D3C76_897870 [compost metagenome]
MRWLLAAAALFAGVALAQTPAVPSAGSLQLLSEHAVEGMNGGNLSGLAWCSDTLWAVSDRDDDVVYRLQPDETAGSIWQAEADRFVSPPVPDTGLSWGTKARARVSGLLRGGDEDFEGISCDKFGNRYLVSEAYAGVLKLPFSGDPAWLELPPSLLRQARASGMLMDMNALYEGIAVDAEGKRLWLAAERQRRGLLAVHRDASAWKCGDSCVLLSEGGNVEPPAELGDDQPRSPDFSDLVWYGDKLFTLERLEHQICRRSLTNGAAERCWSFTSALLAPERRYDSQYGGLAEGLAIDDKGAWIGLDNGDHARADGDSRPRVLRFAVPAGGWLGGK